MIRIELPMSEEQRCSLHAGDAVLLNGTVYTARDAAHKRLTEMLEKNQPIPFELKNACIYYVGPTPAFDGHAVGSAGPTTSSRMDAYTPLLLDHGLTCMIGKGRRSEAVRQSIIAHHAVYFVTVGGAGALLSHCIIHSETIAFEDLLSEAVRKLTLHDFPCFVGIDTEGKDVYDLGEQLPGGQSL